MGLIPNWVYEFPGQLWATFKENASENFPEFKEEVVSSAKAVLGVPAKVIAEVIKPLNRPLIIIGVLLLIVLIFWKKLSKMVGI